MQQILKAALSDQIVRGERPKGKIEEAAADARAARQAEALKRSRVVVLREAAQAQELGANGAAVLLAYRHPWYHR